MQPSISGKILRLALGTLSALLFALGAYLAFNEKVAASTATYGAAVICLIFTFLSRFKRFKGFGIEAELWEQKNGRSRGNY